MCVCLSIWTSVFCACVSWVRVRVRVSVFVCVCVCLWTNAVTGNNFPFSATARTKQKSATNLSPARPLSLFGAGITHNLISFLILSTKKLTKPKWRNKGFETCSGFLAQLGFCFPSYTFAEMFVEPDSKTLHCCFIALILFPRTRKGNFLILLYDSAQDFSPSVQFQYLICYLTWVYISGNIFWRQVYNGRWNTLGLMVCINLLFFQVKKSVPEKLPCCIALFRLPMQMNGHYLPLVWRINLYSIDCDFWYGSCLINGKTAASQFYGPIRSISQSQNREEYIIHWE